MWLSHAFVAGRGPLPGPESGLLSNSWKRVVPGDTRADETKTLLGKDTCAEGGRVGSPRGLRLRFCGNRIRFWVFWPIILTQGPS